MMPENWGGELGFAVREYVREHGVTSFALRIGIDRRNIYQWLRRGVIPSRHEARVAGAVGMGGLDPRGRLLRLMIHEYGPERAARLLGVRAPAMWGWLGSDDYPGWLGRSLLSDFRLADCRGWPDERISNFITNYVDTE